MASGDLIVKVADKDTLDRTYANTNAILAAVGEENKGCKALRNENQQK